MYSHYSHSILFLLSLLLIGCRPGGVAEPKADDPDAHVQTVRQERWELEEKIFKAMDLYQATALKVRTQEEQIKQYLRGKSTSETIDFFERNSNNRDRIPADLQTAFDAWRVMMPDDTQKWQLATWIEKQRTSGLLVDLEIEIKELEHKRDAREIFAEKELDEFYANRARSTVILKENPADAIDKGLIQKKVIEDQKARWANWE